MTFYEQIVNEVQMSNYSRYYNVYASGRTVVPLTKKEPLHYEEQIQDFVQKVKDADCVIVGGASGLSAAGGGDFYYEDNASYRKYFGKYAEKYGFKGAFAGAFAAAFYGCAGGGLIASAVLLLTVARRRLFGCVHRVGFGYGAAAGGAVSVLPLLLFVGFGGKLCCGFCHSMSLLHIV